ncbi:MAG: prolipoprotein diacylglyceryl transferase [Clostridia bacterium]|nr:prolipoprotein diacylglyceryl transferase [Clostridia bacterium]
MTQLLGANTGYVEFPNLFGGLKFSLSEEAFEIFGFSVRWYGLLIGLGVLLCVALGMRACRRYEIEQDDLLDYALFSLPAAVIGARVYYVLFNFGRFKKDLLSVFDIRGGGLAVYGGVIAALLTAFLVSRYKKQSFLKLADFAMPYILLGQAIGRWGNFFNQEAYGGVTTLPWGMTGDQIAVENIYRGWRADTLVHPTFLYESLWCFVGFVVILLYRRSRLKKTNGECVCLYMILYGVERAFVEGLRTDSLMIGNTGIRVSQLLSVILVAGGIALFAVFRVRYRKKQMAENVSDSETTGFEATRERLDAEE